MAQNLLVTKSNKLLFILLFSHNYKANVHLSISENLNLIHMQVHSITLVFLIFKKVVGH